MNRARAHWQALTPSAHALTNDLHTCFDQHPRTSGWTPQRQAAALALTRELTQSWQQERVDLDALRSLEALTAHLNLSSTVPCRSALEGLHSLFRRVAETTYEELDVGNWPPAPHDHARNR